MPLEFSIPVEPDEDGVYDGRQLARYCVAYAYQLLTPYVNGCPACADNLFGVVANSAIEELHEDARKDGALPASIMCLGPPGPKRTAAENAHLKDAMAETARLLQQAATPHPHD